MAEYKFDFLRSFVDKLLDETGFAEMSEATRAKYVPMFIAEAERRLGMALLPLLGEENIDELMQLTDQDAPTEKMLEFWKSKVPNFESEVNKVLQSFIIEFKQTLAKTVI
ncbi:MAG: DUF5663 domain-containing protein [Patescibacteria group bacterium]